MIRVVGMIPDITKEMLAAGVEALLEARATGLTDAETVEDVFLAMAGMEFIRSNEVLH